MIHEAVVKSCASPIGRRDNLVDEPDKCAFDPKALLCKAADQRDCLTAAQVFLMQQTYSGPVNPRTKASIFMGPARGAELGMSMFAKPEAMTVALDIFRDAVFEDPNWDLKSMDYDKTLEAAAQKVGPLLSVDTNLTPFFARGGKLMFYIGWTDYHNPGQLIGYYKSLIANSGAKAQGAVRLFAIPGIAHCGRGEGCDTFNRLGAIDQWSNRTRRPNASWRPKSKTAAWCAPARSAPIQKWRVTKEWATSKSPPISLASSDE